MRNYLLLITIIACSLHAEAAPAPEPTTIVAPATAVRPLTTTPTAGVPGKNLWRVSLTTLAVANALDLQSSWGKRELNSTLAGPNGTFGRQGALLKLGFQGGLIGLEYLITRGHPTGKLYRRLAFINFGASAAIGAVAAHNYTVPRQ